MQDESTEVSKAPVPRHLSKEEWEELRWAYARLEHPSFAARLSNILGTPIEQGLMLLPKSWYGRIHGAVEFSICRALDVALASMEHIRPKPAHNPLHRLSVMATGAAGGLFGPLSLIAELPVTTTIMLRSIADIAHSEGEDLSTLDARTACMQVFALGGRSGDDKAAETGYYGLRISLSLHFSSAPLHFIDNKILNIPGGIELARAITARFGVAVSDQFAAKMIPIAGAVSGALVNLIFMQHFQEIARGHFIVRRLERQYGSEPIRKAYAKIVKEETKATKVYSPVEGW
ncbi:MAG: EcsC family protein [Gammaproteobacteria bacterium]